MASKETPMMSQYRRAKREVPPDTVLFFRLGDFYEMFFDDARIAAGILDIALTKRNKIPMCGVPYQNVEPYLAKMIRAGRKVALCDQVEDASVAKGIVRREVTRIVTPGTVLEENVLDANRSNYIAGLVRAGETFGLALLELSTGAFWIEEPPDADAVVEAVKRHTPSECLVPEAFEQDAVLMELRRAVPGLLVTPVEDWVFEPEAATDSLERHFQVHSLSGFGCDGHDAGIGAAGGVLYYVDRHLRRRVGHVHKLRFKNPVDYMLVDDATVWNLDLLPGPRTGPGADASLLSVLDTTRTPMGGRLLRTWLLRPLATAGPIDARLDAVAALCADRTRLADVREALAAVKDLERLIARLGAGGGNPRDVRSLGVSLEALPALKDRLEDAPASLLGDLAGRVQPLPEVVHLIDEAIDEEPAVHLRDGGVIRAGYHAELDELREAARDGRKWLADFQASEQERTGIRNLKVRHNKVFGYYIEITKSNLADVPDTYVRKQTLVNAERFVTPELKEYENKILGAQDRSRELEVELFNQVRDGIVGHTAAIQQSAEAIAALDVLAAFSDRALALGYRRPVMTDGHRLHIEAGRHPVIEQMPDAERFVPNDTLLDVLENQLVLITGPNMAGKSTYIRQVALIVIMAQVGAFVPARAAEIGVVDRVFTRVGASDDLARGRSTFMVEMQETANILNNATPRSLVVLDEIGRGTSTFDGISIAWAVAEYLHNHAPVKAKTLFATHYHELTDLALTLPGVKNYNVMVRESGDHVVFLRRIGPGPADKSYGIAVARLAGLPDAVIERSTEILTNLEEGEFGDGGQPKIARRRPPKRKPDENQLSLFGEGD